MTNRTIYFFSAVFLFLIALTLSNSVYSQNKQAPPPVKEKGSRLTELESQLETARLSNNTVNAKIIQSNIDKLKNTALNPKKETETENQNDPDFHFELNKDPEPLIEGDLNVSQIHSLNSWSNAVAVVPPGMPNANRIWVAATEYKAGGPDTIKFYYSSNGGSAWVYYGKIYSNINGNYRADEIDIEIIYSGSDVYVFGIATYDNFTNNQSEGIFFRISTTNPITFITRLTNANLGSNYDLYNFRLTSNNTNFTSTAYCLITASSTVDCNGIDRNYGVYYIYADQLFVLPIFHAQPIVTGTSGCPLPVSSNYYVYSDIGYSRITGMDKVFVTFHINAGAAYNYTKVAVYNNYTSLFTTATLSETAENYGQRMAFTGGTSGEGIITYIRKFSGNDWDLACFRTSNGITWTQSTIDQSTKRARWADVTAVRGTTADFKIGYIQDNPVIPAGFYTGNNGSTWSAPTSLVISNQQIDTIYTRVRAGYTGTTGDNCMAVFVNGSTFYGYASRLCQTTVGLTGNEIPVKFSLEQNYPNPFNPATSIKFAIPVSAEVSLKVFDAGGKLVDELLNHMVEAGTHEVNFDASNLASGVYFYRLETNGFSGIRKMVLIK